MRSRRAGPVNLRPLSDLTLMIGSNLRQRVEQGLGLLQVMRVKSLGEPAVDLSERLPGLIPPILPVEQPRETHAGAQVERFFTSAAGYFNRRAEVRLAVARPATSRDQFTLNAVHFWRAESLSIDLADRGESTVALLQATGRQA